MQTIMNPLVNAVILSMSWGCKADTLHGQGMVYGFEDVSLRLSLNHIFAGFQAF